MIIFYCTREEIHLNSDICTLYSALLFMIYSAHSKFSQPQCVVGNFLMCIFICAFLCHFSHQFPLLWKYSVNSMTFYLEFSMNPVLGVTTTKDLKNAFSYIQLVFHLLKISQKIQVDYSMTIQSIVLVLYHRRLGKL